ncbi:MAG: helix-turn-helix domain-containing protein [Ilumatobacteraceae bacterium]
MSRPGSSGGPLAERAARHAALGDPVRLAIVDELFVSDRSPVELRRLLELESNLLAHHLDVLEGVGLIERTRSAGDARRRYVRLAQAALPISPVVAPSPWIRPRRALFVCTRNSARSQLAAALWREMTGAPAESAGTEPAQEVHPESSQLRRRAGLDLGGVASAAP